MAARPRRAALGRAELAALLHVRGLADMVARYATANPAGCLAAACNGGRRRLAQWLARVCGMRTAGVARAICAAGAGGNLGLFRWLVRRFGRSLRDFTGVGAEAMHLAAANGHARILYWSYRVFPLAPWDHMAWAGACAGGCVGMAAWLKPHVQDLGGIIAAGRGLVVALEHGQVPMAHWLARVWRLQPTHRSCSTRLRAVNLSRLEPSHIERTIGAALAVSEGGSISALLEAVAVGGSLAAARWLGAHCIMQSSDITNSAALELAGYYGHTEFIRWIVAIFSKDLDGYREFNSFLLAGGNSRISTLRLMVHTWPHLAIHAGDSMITFLEWSALNGSVEEAQWCTKVSGLSPNAFSPAQRRSLVGCLAHTDKIEMAEWLRANLADMTKCIEPGFAAAAYELGNSRMAQWLLEHGPAPAMRAVRGWINV